MKRKAIAVLSVVLIVIAISTSSVFAGDNNVEGDRGIINSMIDSMRNWNQQAREKGEVTAEQADEWDNHINDMEKYHTENGLGHCGGQTNGSAQNQNYMSGNKNGMMGSSSRGSL